MKRPPNIPPLTAELEDALNASSGILQGDTYVLLRKDAVMRWLGYDTVEELRGELQPAFDSADCGDLTEWNVDEFLTRMQRGAE